MNYVVAASRIEEYVKELFQIHHQPGLVYHNLTHTINVVFHCREIAAHYDLINRDYFTLITAAWFHDTGHLFTGYEFHEEESVRLMTSFVAHQQLYPDLTDAIAACIMATRLPARPKTLLQEIICDADTYHFGTPEFRLTDPLVKQEAELRSGKPFNNWRGQSLQLLTQHLFFTSYCHHKLESGKQANIAYLLSLSPDATF